jgi:hypothetical protein
MAWNSDRKSRAVASEGNRQCAMGREIEGDGRKTAQGRKKDSRSGAFTRHPSCWGAIQAGRRAVLAGCGMSFVQ